jgi:hypothetical protein
MYKFVGALAASLLLGTSGPAFAQNVLQLTATLADPAVCGTQEAGDKVDAHAYVVVQSDVAYQVAAGDKLVYEVLIPNESTLNAGAVDFEGIENAAGGGSLRDSEAKDQYGLYAHPATDLSLAPKKEDGTPNFVRGKWFRREIALTNQEGGTMNNFIIAFDEHDTTHKKDVCPIDKANPKVIAYFRNIAFVGADGTVKKALYTGADKFPDGQTKLIETVHLTDTVTEPAVAIVADPNPNNQ